MVTDKPIMTFPAQKAEPIAEGVVRQTKNPRAMPIAVVLDMGEASREQGFQLNGCR